jgi:hypothetical protein
VTPDLWYSHGGGMNFLGCRKADLDGVDLAALGLPPGWDGGNKLSWSLFWNSSILAGRCSFVFICIVKCHVLRIRHDRGAPGTSSCFTFFISSR